MFAAAQGLSVDFLLLGTASRHHDGTTARLHDTVTVQRHNDRRRSAHTPHGMRVSRGTREWQTEKAQATTDPRRSLKRTPLFLYCRP